MMSALHVGASGMLAQQFLVETTANNIANLNTTAFKKSRPVFQDLFYQNIRQVGSISSDADTIVPVGVQRGLGTRISGVYRIHNQGNLVTTNNALDLAISGRGYFRVEHPNGTEVYSRSGSLQLSAEGSFVTVDGYSLLPEVTVPNDAIEITINRNGQVYASIEGEIQPRFLGQMELATFPNEAGLEAIGDNLYRQTPASGVPNIDAPGAQGYGTLLQGYLESANVEAIEELTAMISAQRAYEMNSKVIETSDQISATTTNIR